MKKVLGRKQSTKVEDEQRQNYAEVYEIESQIVIDAAEVLPSAKEFLKCKLSQKESAN